MHLCINCGSDKVERQGDDFTCRKCHFVWNVAFEQANRVYLRSQGRLPATSVVSGVVSGAEEQRPSTPAEQGDSPPVTPLVEGQETSGAGLPEVPATPAKPSVKGKKDA